MPLCWAHAEYLCLVRSRADGVPFDRIAPVHERYVQRHTGSDIEMWTYAHRLPGIAVGKTLRVIAASPAVIYWRLNDGSTGDVTASETALGLWFADLPTAKLSAGAEIEFTLLRGEKQDGERHRVAIFEPTSTGQTNA
jgi:glucoamylase